MSSFSESSERRPLTSRFRSFCSWFLPAVVVGVAVARVSVWIQPQFSPLVLFPLIIGVCLGILLCGLMQLVNFRDPRLALVGTLAIALLSAGCEHAFYYWDYRREQPRKLLEAGVPEEAITTPGLSEYLQKEAELDRTKVPLWIGNAALMALAACGAVMWYMKSRSTVDRLGQRPVAAADPDTLPEGEASRDS